MLGQIVEIEGEGRRLSLDRGFLSVAGPDGNLGKIPLDDIEAVILSNPAASFTSQIIAALALRGAPLVVCGNDFTPSVYILPVDGHHAQGDRVEAQAASTLPTRKRLWAHIVRAKILAQAAALERVGVNPFPVRVFADKVRSGDPDNLEARAAQRYFPAMFGKGFYRHRDGEGANAFLNYGYTVLRAATARAIVGAGLHPAVDLVAHALVREGAERLDTDTKRSLARVLHADFDTAEGVTPLSNVLSRFTGSLAQIYMNERKKLIFPTAPLPLLAPEDEE